MRFVNDREGGHPWKSHVCESDTCKAKWNARRFAERNKRRVALAHPSFVQQRDVIPHQYKVVTAIGVSLSSAITPQGTDVAFGMIQVHDFSDLCRGNPEVQDHSTRFVFLQQKDVFSVDDQINNKTKLLI